MDFYKKIHKYDIHLMEYCVEIAKKSNMNSKHGCVIIDKKGKIISSACNKRKSMKMEHISDINKRKQKRFSKHAEETALKNVNRNKLKGAILYVIRYGHNENTDETYFLNSKPCEKCTSIIKASIFKYGLKVAYYSTGNNFSEI
jgi:deoxycytidylate deaminase